MDYSAKKMIFFIKNPLLLFIKFKRLFKYYLYYSFSNNFFSINVLKMSLEKIFQTKTYSKGKDYCILFSHNPNKRSLISLLCPTRQRPENVIRLLDSLKSTANNIQEIEVIFYVDIDDKKVLKFFNSFDRNIYNSNFLVIVGDRILLSDMWNICYLESSSNILMHCSDDIIFCTIDWDQLVINKFESIPDKIAFVHGSDGFNSDNFGTHGFLHRNWCDSVGYFVPPFFSSDFNDTWLNHVSDKLARRFYIPIVTEHLHPGLNKSNYDENYLHNINRGINDNVSTIYAITKNQRDLDFLKLKIYIIEYFLINAKSGT